MSEEWTPCRKLPIIVHFRKVKGDREEIITLENREGDSLIATADEDYVMKGVDDELYPIKKDKFHKTYEIVENGQEKPE